MDRRWEILEGIVDEYIRSGEPVSSKALQEKMPFKVSSATIRNEMAELETGGYLYHTHTSAGRIPTVKGYRCYIDRVLPESGTGECGLSEEDRAGIDAFFDGLGGKTDEVVIESASHALAEITKCGVVSLDNTSRFSVITKVDVIPTGRRMYVLLMITSGGNIKNKTCRLTLDLTEEEVNYFKSFVNENLDGLNFEDVSDEMLEGLASALGSYMMSLSPLLNAVAELSRESKHRQIQLRGETNLIASDEVPKNEIVSLLEGKNEFTALLESAFSGITVTFGSEQNSGTYVAENTSVISGGFEKKGKPAGSFGVIGPLRLDYKKIVPYIEYFTNKVTGILSAEEIQQEENNLE